MNDKLELLGYIQDANSSFCKLVNVFMALGFVVMLLFVLVLMTRFSVMEIEAKIGKVEQRLNELEAKK